MVRIQLEEGPPLSRHSRGRQQRGHNHQHNWRPQPRLKPEAEGSLRARNKELQQMVSNFKSIPHGFSRHLLFYIMSVHCPGLSRD